MKKKKKYEQQAKYKHKIIPENLFLSLILAHHLIYIVIHYMCLICLLIKGKTNKSNQPITSKKLLLKDKKLGY